MTALNDAADLIHARLAPVVETMALGDSVHDLAAEMLELLEIDPDDDALTQAVLPQARLVADVVVWRAAEQRAALGFDFSADGGSYQRSQLAKQATEQRQRAEDKAAAAGLAGFDWPAVEYVVPVTALDVAGQWRNCAGF